MGALDTKFDKKGGISWIFRFIGILTIIGAIIGIALYMGVMTNIVTLDYIFGFLPFDSITAISNTTLLYGGIAGSIVGLFLIYLGYSMYMEKKWSFYTYYIIGIFAFLFAISTLYFAPEFWAYELVVVVVLGVVLMYHRYLAYNVDKKVCGQKSATKYAICSVLKKK